MKIDERLNTLCREFSDLEEAEKDYILGVSQALAHSVSISTMLLPVARMYEADNNRDTYVQQATTPPQSRCQGMLFW